MSSNRADGERQDRALVNSYRNDVHYKQREERYSNSMEAPSYPDIHKQPKYSSLTKTSTTSSNLQAEHSASGTEEQGKSNAPSVPVDSDNPITVKPNENRSEACDSSNTRDTDSSTKTNSDQRTSLHHSTVGIGAQSTETHDVSSSKVSPSQERQIFESRQSLESNSNQEGRDQQPRTSTVDCSATAQNALDFDHQKPKNEKLSRQTSRSILTEVSDPTQEPILLSPSNNGSTEQTLPRDAIHDQPSDYMKQQEQIETSKSQQSESKEMSHSTIEDNDINDANWYENEKINIESSDIIQYIVYPEHKIFKMKWNPDAFLEQFRRCALLRRNISIDQQDFEKFCDKKRHFLRMTVMLNTIGVLNEGSYTVDNKNIKLNSDGLRTILYNHRSKLEPGVTLPLTSLMARLHKTTSVSVINKDCLLVYQELVAQGFHPVLLNMANAWSPGGGYRRGDGAQEENLFRRSNYYRSLDMELDGHRPTEHFYCTPDGKNELWPAKQNMYPMDTFGAIYTSGLTVFRQTEDTGYAFMNEPMLDVHAIAMAAYRNPKLDDNDPRLLSMKYSVGTRKKIESIFAIAYRHKRDCLVLSALGCGAFRNPPEHVANIFQSVIEQYAGFFRKICFAILDDHNTGLQFNPHGNYLPFQKILDGKEFAPKESFIVDQMIGPYRILEETSTGEFVLSDVIISPSFPCRYGGTCRDMEDREHSKKYSHPPLCPLVTTLDDCLLKNNSDHMYWFRHRLKCSRGVQCNWIHNPTHKSKYEHATSNHDENQRKDLHRIRAGASNVIDPMNPSHDVDYSENESNLPTCPFSPFHCREYRALSEAVNPQTVNEDIRHHCRRFKHFCRFGGQCRETSKSHWETTIHVARSKCPFGEKCKKINQEEHLYLFSHDGIHDFRRLCFKAADECHQLKKLQHICRYRHRGADNHNGVIPFGQLNKNVDFLRNQTTMAASVRRYLERLRCTNLQQSLKMAEKFIQALHPVYQCSTTMFELMIVSGYVMSYERIKELSESKHIIALIVQHEKIRSIIDPRGHTGIETYIKNYVAAIVAAKYFRRISPSKSGTKGAEASYYSSAHSAPSDVDFENNIFKEETVLKSHLSQTDINTIRDYTSNLIEALFNIHHNFSQLQKPVKVLRGDKSINATFGPRLHGDKGDIAIVFKQDIMHHPDSSFSIQPESSIVNLNKAAFSHRPWISNVNGIQQAYDLFQASKLHCSIVDNERAAALELIAMLNSQTKREIDFTKIRDYFIHEDADHIFESCLPDLIPLNYIAEVHMPQDIFSSLSHKIQVIADTIFGDSLTKVDVKSDSRAARERSKIDTNRQRYRIDLACTLTQHWLDNIDQQRELRGIIITLPASNFVQHVTLPFTIKQIYEKYSEQTQREKISDEIYIYWQAMYGDMMVSLSSEPIDNIDKNSRTNCLICYIAEIPSITTGQYKESNSYLNCGNPFHHPTVLEKRDYLAKSDKFHCGCNVEGFIHYCLKIEKASGLVTLSHAGPNSIYSYETISFRFSNSMVDLNNLTYIHVSAGSKQVPIQNMMVSFHPIPSLHPSFNKIFSPHAKDNRLRPSANDSSLQHSVDRNFQDNRFQSTLEQFHGHRGADAESDRYSDHRVASSYQRSSAFIASDGTQLNSAGRSSPRDIINLRGQNSQARLAQNRSEELSYSMPPTSLTIDDRQRSNGRVPWNRSISQDDRDLTMRSEYEARHRDQTGVPHNRNNAHYYP